MKNFFSGIRPPGSAGKGGKASDAFKQSMKKDAKPMTAQERYKKMMEEKLTAGRQQNAGHGFSLPGTMAPSQEKKELSKNMKMAIEQMAAIKAKKEKRKLKRQAKEEERSKKAAIRAEQTKQQQEAARAANMSKSALWGNNDTASTNTSKPSTTFWGDTTTKKDDGGWW